MFIDFGDGTSVAYSHILAVEYVDELTSLVYTESKTFNVPMPRSVIVSLIESRYPHKDSMSNVEKLLTNIYKNSSQPRP